ncbi:hypothetical protein ACJIZ3_003495 [Penstemon smallii]|uniref:KIB1-4 beta-propeller domain-containing protein n=1 Tax=Penstemon smallii TaxID=265156 RepID=A0ABD3U9E9_9LAMI
MVVGYRDAYKFDVFMLDADCAPPLYRHPSPPFVSTTSLIILMECLTSELGEEYTLLSSNHKHRYGRMNISVQKVALWRNKLADNDFVVLSIALDSDFVVCKNGDNEWLRIDKISMYGYVLVNTDVDLLLVVGYRDAYKFDYTLLSSNHKHRYGRMNTMVGYRDAYKFDVFMLDYTPLSSNHKHRYGRMNTSVRKVALWRNKLADNDFVVLSIALDKDFVVCNNGDNEWLRIDKISMYGYVDVFIRGMRFYALDSNCTLYLVNIENLSVTDGKKVLVNTDVDLLLVVGYRDAYKFDMFMLDADCAPPLYRHPSPPFVSTSSLIILMECLNSFPYAPCIVSNRLSPIHRGLSNLNEINT